jgi:hypothetical protein
MNRNTGNIRDKKDSAKRQEKSNQTKGVVGAHKRTLRGLALGLGQQRIHLVLTRLVCGRARRCARLLQHLGVFVLFGHTQSGYIRHRAEEICVLVCCGRSTSGALANRPRFVFFLIVRSKPL